MPEEIIRAAIVRFCRVPSGEIRLWSELNLLRDHPYGKSRRLQNRHPPGDQSWEDIVVDAAPAIAAAFLSRTL
jgi:hypothetical protein